MNRTERIIYRNLKRRPGEVYITPDGLKLYALAEPLGLICFTGRNFKEMSAEEVNKYIQEKLKQHLDNK